MDRWVVMTGVVFTFLDLEIMTFELLLGVIVYAVIRSYFEDRKWKKRIRGDME